MFIMSDLRIPASLYQTGYFSASGLRINECYNWELVPRHSNWPVEVSPAITGFFTAKEKVKKLEFGVNFCSNTGVTQCLNDLGWNPDFPSPGYMSVGLSLRLSPVSPLCMPSGRCSEDLPRVIPEILELASNFELPLLTGPTEIVLSGVGNNEFLSAITGTNLYPGADYEYIITGQGGTWPVVMNSLTGSLLAPMDMDAKTSIELGGFVCASTGMCPSGTNGLLNYILQNDPVHYFEDKNHYSLIAVQLNLIGSDIARSNTLSIAIKCADCLPIETIPAIIMPASRMSDVDISLSGDNNNYYYFTPRISGIKPNTTYSYTLDTIAGNWPVIISPKVGNIQTSHKYYDVETVLSFCSSVDDCPPGTNGLGAAYSLRNDVGGAYAESNYFTVVEMTLLDENFVTVTTEQMTIRCDNCLPKMTPTPTPYPTPTPSVVPPMPIIYSPFIIMPEASTSGVDVTLSGLGSNYYYCSPRISGIAPNTTYLFTLDGIEGNWPVIISPKNGFISSTESYADIEVSVAFCSSISACPPGTHGLSSNYTIRSDYAKDYNNYFTQLRLTLKDSTGVTITNDQMSIRCMNCLPSPDPTPTPTPTVTPSAAAAFNCSLTITSAINNTTSNYGLGFTATLADLLEFNCISGNDLPATMKLFIGGIQVGSVTYPASLYAGKQFRYTRALNGNRYMGIFSGGSVNLS